MIGFFLLGESILGSLQLVLGDTWRPSAPPLVANVDGSQAMTHKRELYVSFIRAPVTAFEEVSGTCSMKSSIGAPKQEDLSVRASSSQMKQLQDIMFVNC